MKNTVIAALLGAMSVLSAGAATTITATNNGGAATRQLQSSLGVPLTNAYSYEVGVFAGDTFSVSTTLADFTSAGSSLLSASQPGLFGAFGSAGIVVDLPNTGDPAGTFVNRPIFVVIRELGDTGRFIAFSTPSSFAFENALNVGTAVSVTNANLTLIKGTLQAPGTNVNLTGAAAAGLAGSAITFVAVPEPSAALLGAFGVLGLLRRRRN